MGLYVEILIRAPMDRLWEHTQNPSLHERWDLRFSTIEYLPRPDPAEPQRFLYATRIGFGFQVAGEGDSLGERDLPGGLRVSSLKFSSEDARSIIREGSGYWKYIPTPDGIRFLTWYDYRTRFGRAGALFDRIAFRPMLGWATAWSFDRLRLWLERGLPPDVALRRFLTHAYARGAMAFVFAYHGLVPKLLRRDVDELAMLRAAHVPQDWAPATLAGAGVAELAFALILLRFWGRRWPAVAGACVHVDGDRDGGGLLPGVPGRGVQSGVAEPERRRPRLSSISSGPPTCPPPGDVGATLHRATHEFHLPTRPRFRLREAASRDPAPFRLHQRGRRCLDRSWRDGRGVARALLHACPSSTSGRGVASCSPRWAGTSPSRSRITPSWIVSAARP